VTKLFVLLSWSVICVFAQTELADLKRMEVERLRAMAEAGAIPRARLDQAQAELADAEDNAILRRTLYGPLRIEDYTKVESDLMTLAAERLVNRQMERIKRTEQLVNEGIIARAVLMALNEDLHFRQKALDLAIFRAKLVTELAEQAESESELDDTLPGAIYSGVIERFDGGGIFREIDFAKILIAFQKQFARPLPVSAKGATALHRSLGFDHRGRVDIALNPDQQEGIWLRNFLKKAKIPYYAFRAAVRGKATAPHIHLGPPSLRLRIAD
jgi:hypothetical protein